MSDSDNIYWQQQRPSETTDSELGGATTDDNDDDNDAIVATSDMCHYCFDVLLKELLPESSESSRNHHFDFGSSSSSSSNSRSPKRRHTTKKSTTNNDGSEIYQNNTLEEVRERLEQQTYKPPDVECPLFVTWSKLRPSSNHPPILTETSSSGITTPTTASSSNICDDETSNYDDSQSEYDLRGCIGTLAPKKLTTALSEFAITSAIHDQRFDPITLKEVPHLRVGVSLLVKYEECDHCMDWSVGVHGIIIKFESIKHSSRGGSSGGSSRGGERTYSATYLPEVAYEQRWTQEEAIISLVRKAGYRGVISDELLARIRCTRYQSSKCRLSYREYMVARGYDGRGGVDPLLREGNSDMLTAAAVDEAMMRQRGKGPRTCATL